MKKFILFVSLASLGFASIVGAQTRSEVHPHSSKHAQIIVHKKEKKHGKVDLNTADVHKLAKMVQGIGKHRATAIVAYRKKHGKFKKLADLAKVRGISQRFVKLNSQYLQSVLQIQ